MAYICDRNFDASFDERQGYFFANSMAPYNEGDLLCRWQGDVAAVWRGGGGAFSHDTLKLGADTRT